MQKLGDGPKSYQDRKDETARAGRIAAHERDTGKPLGHSQDCASVKAWYRGKEAECDCEMSRYKGDPR